LEINNLKKYKNIIVTGAHRSGTTFIAYAIANDLGYTFLDESNINMFHLNRLNITLDRYDNCVLQAPYLISWLPIIEDKDTFFVIVKRNRKDIAKSVNNSKTIKGKKISKPAFSAKQAYGLFDKIKPLLNNYIEIQYKDFKDHPLFVENRNNWHHKQVDETGKRYIKKEMD